MRYSVMLWSLWSGIILIGLKKGEGKEAALRIGSFLLMSVGLKRERAPFQRLVHAQRSVADTAPLEALLAERAGRAWLLIGGAPILLRPAPIFALCLIGLCCGYVSGLPYSLLRRERRVLSAVQSELPEALNRLIFSLRAGVIVEMSWRQVADSADGALFEEMRAIFRRRDEGVGISDAYRGFGKRFDWAPVNEVGEAMAQSISLGAEALTMRLERIRKALIDARRREYEVEVQAAAQRLIFPSLLIFTGIMILVIVPMLGHTMSGL